MRSTQSILPSAHTEVTQEMGHPGASQTAHGISQPSKSTLWAQKWALTARLGLCSKGSRALVEWFVTTCSLEGDTEGCPPGLKALLNLSWDVNSNNCHLKLRNEAELVQEFLGFFGSCCTFFLFSLLFTSTCCPQGVINLTWKIEVLVHLNTTVLQH